jgi:cell division protein FtsI (penicillin-binding protein 3)
MVANPEVRQPGRSRRGGLTEARAYHPRGRTVRDRPPAGGRGDRGAAAADPFRPALTVFDADRAAGRKPAGKGRPAGKAQPAPARAGKGRPAAPRAGKGQPAARRSPARVRRSPAPPRLASPRRRLRLATVLALAVFAALGIRLVELQLTDGPAYAASGLEDRLLTVVLPASRGTIYDRDGGVLAHSVEARYVYADPEQVVDPAGTATRLAPLLGLPAGELVARMQPRVREDGVASRFEWLARGVDMDTADEITSLNLPGIGVAGDERRIVPGRDLAANLLGFTGTDLVGLEGLEAHYDDVLRGVDGEWTYERGLGVSEDREIPSGYQVETPPQPGSDLRLTLDMDLQYRVQEVLAERLVQADATFGAAVVLDVATGEVLAQASYPGYDLTDPHAVPAADRADAATTRVFDPGSSHKPLVIGAALEEGVIGAGDSLVVDSTVYKGDQLFQDAIPHAPGTRMSLAAVLAFSSNVGTIQIADRLGPEKLYEYQRGFGLGEPTGLGVPYEASGALLPPDQWYESSYGSVPIGHSVDVTTLQMAAAYATIANDGVWQRPQLVQAVIAPDGSQSRPVEPVTRRVLSPETSGSLRLLLEAVVSVPGGTGQAAALEDYRVAGKTGTGKLVVDGKYAPGDVASFVGMAPAEDPRYVIAVVAHTPAGGGGEVAGPAFREMMGFTLDHYRVPPATTDPPTFELYP